MDRLHRRLPSLANRPGLAFTLVLLTALAGGGCTPVEPSFGRFSYRVTLDERLARDGVIPSIEVDFVAVTPTQRERWAGLDLGAYFRPDSPMRSGADRHTMSFTDARRAPQVLPSDGTIWKSPSWAAAESMFILANTGMSGLEDLPCDPWRLELTLDRDEWKKVEQIDIVVRPNGLDVVTRRTGKPTGAAGH